MPSNESTVKIKADISKLKSEMQAAARQVRVVNSEFRAATAGMDDWTKSEEGLSAKLKQLNSTLDAQKKQLDLLNQELEKTIAYLRSILNDEQLLLKVIKDELTVIRDKFGDDRRTEIQDVEDEIDIEDLIEEEECVFTLTQNGYIKRTPASEYSAQRRGGKGVKAMTTREEDVVVSVFTASTHDYILFFTNTGKVHRKKGYLIPEAGRAAKGTNIVNVLPLEAGEYVTAGLSVRKFDDSFLVMITRMGTVKRLELSSLNTARKAGIRALSLDEGDELIEVRRTDGQQNILLVTREGMAICFRETDIRCMGRDAVGVRGIRLKEGDYVVAGARAHEGQTLLTITENGFGKRTDIEEYLRGEGGEPQKRGGSGMKNYNITDKTGKVVAAKVVTGEEDILMISDDGTIIRMPTADINIYGRVAQGVRVMRLKEGVRVISVARAEKEQTEENHE